MTNRKQIKDRAYQYHYDYEFRYQYPGISWQTIKNSTRTRPRRLDYAHCKRNNHTPRILCSRRRDELLLKDKRTFVSTIMQLVWTDKTSSTENVPRAKLINAIVVFLERKLHAKHCLVKLLMFSQVMKRNKG
jgi:hypothetical protein